MRACPTCGIEHEPAPSKYYDYRCKACQATRAKKARLADPLKFKERDRKSKAKHAERIKHARALWASSNAGKRYAMWYSAKVRAVKDGIPFSITVDDVMIPEFCPLLGIAIEPGNGAMHAASPSLDRIQPELGYIPGNVWVVSFRANAIKQDACINELETLTTNLKRRLLK